MVDHFIHAAFYRLRESERDNKTNQLQNAPCGGKGKACGNDRTYGLGAELGAYPAGKLHQCGVCEQGKQDRARQTAHAVETNGGEL